jgi:predicted ATPase/class 3 adenylate cyclase/Tfp pilus assembly protein PilF
LADQLAIAPPDRTTFIRAARAELSADRLAPPVQHVGRAPSPIVSNLPSGTVTFLFTDIEGSTRLWEQHPQLMPDALARHDAILHQAIAEQAGAVYKIIGDDFQAAFPTAPAACAAALAAQRALAAEAWGVVGTIPVRMALHTCASEPLDGDYRTGALNRLGRLLSASHGGQIVLSRSTADLARDHLPPDLELRELGEHRLRDLSRPEHIFQLVAPNLPDAFPSLRTLERPRTNLPAQPTPLIGRAREVEQVCTLLRTPDVRLVTLTGPGGVGKTRLALQAAAEALPDFAHGAYVVNLAPISDPALVVATIAQTLGVKEHGSRPLLERLTDELREQQLLLLLDNFEQVLTAAPQLTELLVACPKLKLLITSREVLHLYGEHEFGVPPLSLPDRAQLPPLERLMQYDAVRLFIERARALKADFAITNASAPAVAEICYRLDGLPLAIELAAARIKLFSPQALLSRLEHRLALLTGGGRDLPARHQTIRGAIDWSYHLLDAAEQRLFARLGVFVGGCMIEAAAAACNADGALAIDVTDGVASLVDKSLLRLEGDADGEPRVSMLETIREYALERLEAEGEVEVLRRGHAEYYLVLAEAAEPALSGPQQGTWMERLEHEHDNLRAALAWSQTAAPGAELGLRLAAALGEFWWVRGYLREGRAWLAQVLAHPQAAAPALARTKALRSAGHLASDLGDLATGDALYTESLALSRALADQHGSATTLANMGHNAWNQGDLLRATALCEESLALHRELGDRHGSAWALCWLGAAARDMGDYVQSMAHFEASLALYQELGNTWGRVLVLHSMGDATCDQGETARATTLYQEALMLSRQVGHGDLTALALSNLGYISQMQGDSAQAQALLEESVAWLRQTKHQGLAWALYRLGMVASAQGDDVRATAVLREALILQQQSGLMKGVIVRSLERLAGLAARQQRPARAAQLFGAAETLREAIGAPLPPSERVDYDRDVAGARAQLDEATFAAAWAQGCAMTLEQAIELALDEEM